jgi:hypothetical protein
MQETPQNSRRQKRDVEQVLYRGTTILGSAVHLTLSGAFCCKHVNWYIFLNSLFNKNQAAWNYRRYVRRKQYRRCTRKIAVRPDLCSVGPYSAWQNVAANREAFINNVALNPHWAQDPQKKNTLYFISRTTVTIDVTVRTPCFTLDIREQQEQQQQFASGARGLWKWFVLNCSYVYVCE